MQFQYISCKMIFSFVKETLIKAFPYLKCLCETFSFVRSHDIPQALIKLPLMFMVVSGKLIDVFISISLIIVRIGQR